MPNHISNVLRLYADDKERMDQVISEITSDENLFDFNVFFPYPEAYRLADEAAEAYRKENGWQGAPPDGYNHGGYEWCVANWGTKWNSYSHRVRQENTWGMYAIYFETAWAWPKRIIEAFLERYPDLEVVHVSADEGGGFATHLALSDGKKTLTEWNARDGAEEVIVAIWEGIRE